VTVPSPFSRDILTVLEHRNTVFGEMVSKANASVVAAVLTTVIFVPPPSTTTTATVGAQVVMLERVSVEYFTTQFNNGILTVTVVPTGFPLCECSV
jgi:hypothetical protein